MLCHLVIKPVFGSEILVFFRGMLIHRLLPRSFCASEEQMQADRSCSDIRGQEVVDRISSDSRLAKNTVWLDKVLNEDALDFLDSPQATIVPVESRGFVAEVV